MNQAIVGTSAFMRQTTKTSLRETHQSIWQWLLNPPATAPQATILLRLMAGGVFFWEGLLKFVYTNQGVGRFTKIGIPFPQVMGPFIGWLEIIGGLFLIVGVLTRPLAIIFIIEMMVAIASTKISLFLGHSPLPLPPSPPQIGFWAVLHEIRSDYAQLMTCLFLALVGPGPLSLDGIWRHTGRSKNADVD